VTEERSTDSGIDDGELLDPSELDPALAMPSSRVYRGSLMALLLGSIFAIGLLILSPVGTDRDQPPASIGGIISGPAPTPTPTPTPTQTATATPSATVTTTATAEAITTAEPTAAPVPAETTTYTVQPGDTMFWIAELFLPAGRELDEFVDEISAVNEVPDPTLIQVGQVLDIPGQ